MEFPTFDKQIKNDRKEIVQIRRDFCVGIENTEYRKIVHNTTGKSFYLSKKKKSE
jgi:hypothetical protein